jgi:hypothetical protein
MKRSEKPKTVDDLLDYIYTNAGNQKATRLVLVIEEGRERAVVKNAVDLGGWSKPALKDLISDFLEGKQKKIVKTIDEIFKGAD